VYTRMAPGGGLRRPAFHPAHTNHCGKDASSTMTNRLIAAMTLLAAGMTLCAQQPKSLIAVATFKVAPGQESAFVKKGKAFEPVLDKLIAEGVVSAYGMNVDMLHVPERNNVDFWVEVKDFAALDKEEKALDEFEKANASMMAELRAMADLATHHDLIIGVREGNFGSVPAGSMPVDDFDVVRVQPGRMSEFMELIRKYDKPVLDKLVADGVIYGWEADTEAVHTMAPGLVWLLVVMPDLGTKDKVEAAFEESFQKLPEGERNMMEKLYRELTVPGSHRDELAVSLVFKTK